MKRLLAALPLSACFSGAYLDIAPPEPVADIAAFAPVQSAPIVSLASLADRYPGGVEAVAVRTGRDLEADIASYDEAFLAYRVTPCAAKADGTVLYLAPAAVRRAPEDAPAWVRTFHLIAPVDLDGAMADFQSARRAGPPLIPSANMCASLGAATANGFYPLTERAPVSF
ncbi:MAG: hypothetical protein AAFR11_12335 [Pseudomonadota bacterium]